MASINKVSEQWNQWKELEKEIASQFHGSLEDNRAFQVRKLSHLERMEVRFAGTTSISEQLVLVALKDVRRKLERKLFPGRIIRLIRKGLKKIYDLRRESRMQKESLLSIARIKETLARSGFAKVAAKVEQYLQLGKLTIPISEYPGATDRLDLEFKIRHDATGAYALEGYRASVYPDGKKEGMRVQFFPAADQELLPSWERTYHLLSGRAVLKGPDALSERRISKWLQLDFNDKDAQGNYKVREFPDFDLDRQLNSLKLPRSVDPLAIKMDLQNGREVRVVSRLDSQQQPTILSVRPQRGIVIPLNAQGEEISPNDRQAGKQEKMTVHISGQQPTKKTMVKKMR